MRKTRTVSKRIPMSGWNVRRNHMLTLSDQIMYSMLHPGFVPMPKRPPSASQGNERTWVQVCFLSSSSSFNLLTHPPSDQGIAGLRLNPLAAISAADFSLPPSPHNSNIEPSVASQKSATLFQPRTPIRTKRKPVTVPDAPSKRPRLSNSK